MVFDCCFVFWWVIEVFVLVLVINFNVEFIEIMGLFIDIIFILCFVIVYDV